MGLNKGMVKWLLRISNVLFIYSFFGAMFFSGSSRGYGLLAFVIVFIIGVSRHGFKGFKPSSDKIMPVVMAAFVPLFLTAWFLSGNRGAPDPEGKPVFAKRVEYNFTRTGPAERWRFVMVLVCFHLMWHGFGIVFTGELLKSLSEKQTEI